MKVIFILFLSLILLSTFSFATAEEKAGEEKSNLFNMQDNQKNLPTYIKSDSLTVKSEERTFVYSGNVEVQQGDMTITSDFLDGFYDENNKIQQLVARANVVIIKGESIRAHGERATYESSTETVVLTENPELQQNGSVLSADLIRIFLKENRSTAEGAVRVKVVDEKKSAGKKSEPLDLKSVLKN